MGREAVSRLPPAEIQHVEGGHLDPQIDSGSYILPDARLHFVGDIHVYSGASPVGSQRRRELRKPRVLYDIRVRSELHLSGDRYHHGRHAGVHSAGAEDRFANEMLCRNNNGPWVAVR